MKKRIFTVLVLVASINCVISAQEIERLTFTERRSDGTIVGNVTVNAVFMGWSQQRVTIENGMQITQESFNIRGSNEWSPWEIMQRAPAYMPTLRQMYDLLLGEYNRHPRSAIRLHMQGIQGVRIMTIRSGSSSPMWWSDDGKSFNVLYEFWAIIK
ncbi:MAG: hypothetical protein LBH43_07860 [Treponema sp.]|jgi:hypothetical protein|nr:hypothetical protein [Treponema sp.]